MDFVHDEHLYLGVVKRTIITGYFTAAAVSMLVWDWLTHLEDEIEYIWKRDWKMAGKPFYLVVRYSGFMFQIFDFIQILAPWSEKFCEGYYVLLPLGTAGLLVLVDAVLAYRMLCLYEMNHRLLVMTIILFSMGAASTAGIIGYSNSGFNVVATPRFVTGCWISANSTVFMALIPPLVFEVWLFILVLKKLYSHVKEAGGLSQKTLARVLLRDSMNWFFIISAMIVWNGLNLGLAPEGARGVALPVLRSFIIMGGCRLVIHMRKQVFRQQSTSDTAVSTSIRFGVPDSDERHHHWTKSRAISIAQQIGLPPPTAEMASMWPESEADSIGTDSSSPANGDILLRPLGPDQGHSDTDAPSSVYVPAPGSGATLALPV